MKPRKVNHQRRSFLRRAVTTGAAAGAATLSLDAAADALVMDRADAEQKTSGYRLSDHVAAYYKSQTR
jgi:hypothetical protein